MSIHHVLYSEDGRSRQLEVHGPLTEVVLLTPALLQEQEAPGRLIAMRRLCDMRSGRKMMARSGLAILARSSAVFTPR